MAEPFGSLLLCIVCIKTLWTAMVVCTIHNSGAEGGAGCEAER